MSRRLRVGVTSSLGGGRYMWWFYYLALRQYGLQPVRLIAPVRQADMHSFEGLIIGGGDDISAELYNGEPTLDVRVDPARDEMELELLEHSAPRDMPVLGVCRGAQMLNVHRGGSLHQDMYESYNHVPRMWTPLPRKRVHIRSDTRLGELLREEGVTVNSLHRQAIDRLGNGLEISARDEFGVTQAIEDPAARFRIGVQWHPEFLIYRPSQRRLFRAFVRAVKAYATE